MNVFRRIRLWWKEDVHRTIREDFGGDLLINTSRGLRRVPGSYVYDRATKVYDTLHPEVWAAFGGHDWDCDELDEGRSVVNVDGIPMINNQNEADDELYLEMLHAARLVYIRILREIGDRKKALAESRDVVRRALVYRRGVGAWNKIAKRIGIR